MLASEDRTPALAADLSLVRVGIMGQVGRFRASEIGAWRRGDQVVCRTSRGVEAGTWLGPADVRPGTAIDVADGQILREFTSEDRLLWEHLQRLGNAAHQACAEWLANHGHAAVLLDVEPLLDGRTLYFHFLSDVEPPVQAYLDELVAIYERQVQQSKFARLLEHGCGPGCGTAAAKNGCGSASGCAVCQVAKHCQPASQANAAGSESH